MPIYDEDELYNVNKKKNGVDQYTISYDDWVKNGYSTGVNSNGKGSITRITNVPVVAAPVNDPKFNYEYLKDGYVDNTTWGTYTPKKTTTASTGNVGGSGGASSIIPDYKANLDDLYNKVMGYGGYSYTPYTPGSYSPTVDTSGTQAALKSALGDIQGYGDFKYDLNADLLYQNAVDNYMLQGQKAMMDTNAAAAALSGGYGNSWAASVGNQAYQDYITQANNMIPQYRQMALNTWQSGLDRRMSVYDAISQQLANELSIEDMAFAIWAQNEANAANAHSMNSQGAFNEWSSGLEQLLGQYDVTKDYYGTLEALQKASGGGSSSGTSNKATENTVYYHNAYGDALKNMAANMAATPGNPYTQDQLYEALKQQNAYNNEQRYLEQKKNRDKK